jgi:hypothetical protein
LKGRALTSEFEEEEQQQLPLASVAILIHNTLATEKQMDPGAATPPQGNVARSSFIGTTP